jgi:hypothetical protein
MATPRYVRIDPERTGVTAAADDVTYTYLGFDRPVPDDLQLFDSEGQALLSAKAGPVVAIQGLHSGILVRAGRNNSFVTKSPRTAALPQPAITDDPTVIEARHRLEVIVLQRPLFERAMQRADERTAASAPPSRAVDDRPIVERARTESVVPPLPKLAAPAIDDPTYVRRHDGVMIRIFFASGGRAIVRPDDGLQRLEEEARDAMLVRVAGYTDSLGEERSNAMLARARAWSIRDLLIRRGIPADKIVVTAADNTRYLADNASESGRALNRRVEVVLVKDSSQARATSSTEPSIINIPSRIVR